MLSNNLRSGGRQLPVVVLGLAWLVTGCAGDSSSVVVREGSSTDAQGGAADARRGGSITVALNGELPVMAPIAVASQFPRIFELHSVGLVTSDEQSAKPLGRLATRVPSVENGDITILPDGTMRVVYALREGVTWHDGTPFTAQDMLLGYRVAADPQIPFGASGPLEWLASAEAPDNYTFVMNFRKPYFRAHVFGVEQLWPLPRHILGPAYEAFRIDGDAEAVINHPYWRSEYIHMGAFRLVSFDPSSLITLQAYDGYFLGQPKIDIINVQIFTDRGALYASLLAGTVDVFMENTLAPSQGFGLKELWDQSGAGTVLVKRGSVRFIAPQHRLAYQAEPTVATDPRVRASLYHAVDRELMAEALQGGHRELAAWEILGPDQIWHEAAKDAMRQYGYDPRRAQALLAEAGWTPGPDGRLRHSSDGRQFRAPIRTTGDRFGDDASVVADSWRAIGVAVEEELATGAMIRDNEYRSKFPGFELSSAAQGDATPRMQSPPANAENRWRGNRMGYENQLVDQLIDRWQTSISLNDQLQAVKELSDIAAADLPLLVLYYNAYHLGTSKRVEALDDHAGGNQLYGTFSRNGHLWALR